MMLSHLDDPRPFTPDDAFRAAVDGRSRRVRHRRRLTRALAVAALVGVATAGGGLYVVRRDAAIDRVDVSTQPSTDGATNVLIVGPDISGNNADSIVVARIDASGTFRILSVPRDLWDQQAESRINATYGEGVQALIDSVQRVTGVPVDHYVELNFEGFIGLVDELGGLPIAVQAPFRDAPTGLQLDQADCVTVDGTTLLALVRARHLQVRQPDGTWEADPTADLGRIARAQTLMTIAIGQLADAETDPLALDRYSRILADHARLDSDLTLGRLVDLAEAIAAAGPDKTITDTLPVQAGTAPLGASVLHLASGANSVLDTYGGTHTSSSSTPEPSASATPLLPLAPC